MNIFWHQILVPALNAFALAGSLAGLAIGVGLLAAAPATLAFFDRMNRRISMRQATRALEVPRDIEGAPARRHPALGVAFLLGGGYTAVMLLTQLDAGRAADAFRVGQSRVVLEVALEATRWFLVVGGAAAVALGALLLFRPDAWIALEARANRWVSTRQMMRPTEEMHYGLDRLVERHPRAAGAILVVTSLVATAAFGFLLLR